MSTETHRTHKPLLLYGGIAAGFVLLVLLLGGGFLLLERRTADYPDATILAEHINPSLRGYPSLRQDVAFRTSDPFPEVYNWYSVGFDLGPETYAQGSCILIENSQNWFILRRHMSATICDTPGDRLIFIERTLALGSP